MILIIDVIFFSWSCLIDEGDSFLLTGGAKWGDSVTTAVSRYNMNGWVEYLDNLITARSGHGCSQFTNKNGYKVGSHENIDKFNICSDESCLWWSYYWLSFLSKFL